MNFEIVKERYRDIQDNRYNVGGNFDIEVTSHKALVIDGKNGTKIVHQLRSVDTVETNEYGAVVSAFNEYKKDSFGSNYYVDLYIYNNVGTRIKHFRSEVDKKCYDYVLKDNNLTVLEKISNKKCVIDLNKYANLQEENDLTM